LNECRRLAEPAAALTIRTVKPMSLRIRASATDASELPGEHQLARVETSVSIQNIRKSYGAVVAVDDVTLDVRRGEFFSLLGPSGCGKTSLLRIIGGFEDFDSGQLLLDGRDMHGVPPYVRSTNMIFQNLALFPHMNVFENVAFGLRRKRVSHGDIVTRVDDVLRLVRLQGFEKRMPDQLSGGQRQRVAMARALVNRPSVLLLDEPLGALDLQLRINMQEELRRLHRALGNTFIFVTHDQGEAMSMSDRIAIMNGGKVQQIGSPEDIYENPKNRFVAAFVGHTNLLDGVVAGTAGGGTVVQFHGMTMSCRGASDLVRGQKVTIALRYEKVGLATSIRSGQQTTVTGLVTDRTYLGNAVRLVTRIGDGINLTADIADTAQVRDVTISDTVQLSFAGDSAVAVPD
jgi:spermidine/putrescine transport system ATP-binding protein